jgi:hypothetical protein
MSRVIKFRAWHKGANQMLESRDQGYQGEVFKWLHEGQPIEIMQFTGLLDKNGKEIYESDIVGFSVREVDKVKMPAIHHAKGVVVINPFTLLFGSWDAGYCHNIKVIGNVYENPELAS